MVTLKCGCKVLDNGKFAVGVGCKRCKECNLVSKLHPFGIRRLGGSVE